MTNGAKVILDKEVFDSIKHKLLFYASEDNYIWRTKKTKRDNHYMTMNVNEDKGKNAKLALDLLTRDTKEN